MTDALVSCASTHAGAVRPHNEDAYLDRPDIGLWAVADGAGGHAAGEVASRMIVDALGAIPPELGAEEMLAQVRIRLTATHFALREEAAGRGAGAVVASTVVVLLVRQQHFVCLWAGDSRAYLLRDGRLVAITRDHSLVQELVDFGTLAEDMAASHPAANVITRAVGAGDDALELDKVIGEVRPGDRFLLCSDGLCKAIGDARIETLLQEAAAGSVCEALVEAALALDATDNVTALTVTASGNPAPSS